MGAVSMPDGLGRSDRLDRLDKRGEQIQHHWSIYSGKKQRRCSTRGLAYHVWRKVMVLEK